MRSQAAEELAHLNSHSAWSHLSGRGWGLWRGQWEEGGQGRCLASALRLSVSAAAMGPEASGLTLHACKDDASGPAKHGFHGGLVAAVAFAVDDLVGVGRAASGSAGWARRRPPTRGRR